MRRLVIRLVRCSFGYGSEIVFILLSGFVAAGLLFSYGTVPSVLGSAAIAIACLVGSVRFWRCGIYLSENRLVVRTMLTERSLERATVRFRSFSRTSQGNTLVPVFADRSTTARLTVLAGSFNRTQRRVVSDIEHWSGRVPPSARRGTDPWSEQDATS